MRIETERKGLHRDTHSKALTFSKGDAYEAYVSRKKTNDRITSLEDKLDRILRIMEKNNGIT